MKALATTPRWTDLLNPAREHAALGEQLPRLSRFPAPVRWFGRAYVRLLILATRSITKRQKAYNLAMLEAVNKLAQQVDSLKATQPIQPQHQACTQPEAPPPGTPASFNAIYNSSSWMEYCERVLLYSLVYGVRPKRVLEIGTFLGGSALIIAAALDDIGDGIMVCVDPNPRLPQENIDRIQHRATIVAAPSPEGLHKAMQIAGDKFDFALIDGDHSYEGVVRDIEGTLPVVLPNSYLLFHDAHNEPVRRGINDMLAKYKRDLQDCGMMSTFANPDKDNPGVLWGGIRVLRYQPDAG